MVPASTTRVSFSTVTRPLARSTRTRAMQATQVGMSRSWPKLVATPSPVSFGVGRRSGIAPGAIQQTQPERHRINPCGVGSLVHEAFHRPVGPARPDRAQPTGPEGSVGEIIGQRANPLRSHRVPVTGAAYREGIIRDAVGVL